jgi:hypothetical protein
MGLEAMPVQAEVQVTLGLKATMVTPEITGMGELEAQAAVRATPAMLVMLVVVEAAAEAAEAVRVLL